MIRALIRAVYRGQNWPNSDTWCHERPRLAPLRDSSDSFLVGFCEVYPQKWPLGRCAWLGGCLSYTGSGKKLASAPLPRS
jgi:hypothetical protein